MVLYGTTIFENWHLNNFKYNTSREPKIKIHYCYVYYFACRCSSINKYKNNKMSSPIVTHY